MGNTEKSPFFSRGVRGQNSKFILQNSRFQKYFSNFLLSSGTDFIKIKKSEFSLFLDSPIYINKINVRIVEEIAKECYELTNISSTGEIASERSCVYITNSFWNSTERTAVTAIGAVLCENVNFTRCYSQDDGGGIKMISSNDCELTNCIFDQCSAARNGAAFYLSGKNIKIHMVNIKACTSDNKTSVMVHSRSFVARHFYVDKYSSSIVYNENPVYYLNYYAVIRFSVINTNLVLNVTNVTMSNVEINCGDEQYAIMSTATNISLYNVAFSGGKKCAYFDSVILSYSHSEIYAKSRNECEFYPKINDVELLQYRPGYPEATKIITNSSPSSSSSNSDQSSGQTSDGGLKSWHIALIVIASLIGACAIAGTIYFCITHTECTCKNDEMVTTYNFG